MLFFKSRNKSKKSKAFLTEDDTEFDFEEEQEDSQLEEENSNFYAIEGYEGEDIPPNENMEYEIVEREILPAKIICPDCGGITLEGLEFCDKCGGEI